jgi:hypothetical protein
MKKRVLIKTRNGPYTSEDFLGSLREIRQILFESNAKL